jgi:hypothetical protein
MNKDKPFWFEFDPTIHAGHVLTAVTIVFCSMGAWYNITTSILSLKEENSRQEVRMNKIEDESKEKFSKIQSDLTTAAIAQHQELVSIREDINKWFTRLDDKLDRKADKRN